MRRRRLAIALVWLAGCGRGEPPIADPLPGEFERAEASAERERTAALRRLAALPPAGGDPLDRWRRVRAETDLERAVLRLDALQRRRLEQTGRSRRAAAATTATAWERVDATLAEASEALRAGRLREADSLYGRAARVLAPERSGVPFPLPTLTGRESDRSLRRIRVSLDRRLAELERRRTILAPALADLEDELDRHSGLARFRGVRGRGPRAAEEAGEERIGALRTEIGSVEERIAALRSARDRVDAILTARMEA